MASSTKCIALSTQAVLCVFHRYRWCDFRIRHSFDVNPNQKNMSTISLIKEIYINAFKNISNFIVKRYFKAFAIFSFIMFLIVLYAFIYRVYTGFPFQ